jgi:translation initiation factor IF-3
LNRPFFPRSSAPATSFVRVNGQMGVFQLPEALTMARNAGVDLVEIAPNATPPVCRLVDFGKYRYEQAKKEKESRKHQHANKVKEIQLSPSIDPHDFGVKLTHAIDFLCDEMKVKVTLRFRGREMAHQEFGFQQVRKFIVETAPYGHPDAEPKLIGKGINVMLSPLPRNKRAKNPRQSEDDVEGGDEDEGHEDVHAEESEPEVKEQTPPPSKPKEQAKAKESKKVPTNAAEKSGSNFGSTPFAQLDVKSAE